MQITEFKINNEYIPKIIIFGDKNKSIKSDEEEEKKKSKGKFFEEGFDSVESKNIKVFISNKSIQSPESNSNSIVPSSSNDELFVWYFSKTILQNCNFYLFIYIYIYYLLYL